MRVAVVDSGANFASVRAALARCNANFMLTHDADELRNASHVILPGVGNVGDSWSRLEAYGLLDTIAALTQPVLGICVGMQLMFEHCEEAGRDTLGIFDGRVSHLKATPAERVPHCGWNQIDVTRSTPLTDTLGQRDNDYVYFVHSFAAQLTDQTLATATHGDTFTAAVAHNNFYGVQFHPERSAQPGQAWLRAFLAMT
jgi:glutamine amidotransferase